MTTLTEAEREDLGQRVMLAMICTHDGEEFGDKAVCATCWENTQRVCRAFETQQSSRPPDCHCDYSPNSEGPEEDCPHHGREYAYWVERSDALAARLASVRALADEWAAEGDEMSHWFAAQVLYDLLDQAHPAVLGSDAHTDQNGAGECRPCRADGGYARPPSDTGTTLAFIRALVNAWDCCGTCAGGVLAARDRKRDLAVLAALAGQGQP